MAEENKFITKKQIVIGSALVVVMLLFVWPEKKK